MTTLFILDICLSNSSQKSITDSLRPVHTFYLYTLFLPQLLVHLLNFAWLLKTASILLAAFFRTATSTVIGA